MRGINFSKSSAKLSFYVLEYIPAGFYEADKTDSGVILKKRPIPGVEVFPEPGPNVRVNDKENLITIDMPTFLSYQSTMTKIKEEFYKHHNIEVVINVVDEIKDEDVY